MERIDTDKICEICGFCVICVPPSLQTTPPTDEDTPQ